LNYTPTALQVSPRKLHFSPPQPSAEPSVEKAEKPKKSRKMYSSSKPPEEF
jgi:hypothetical protein